jgi:hypothetical protein
MEETWKPIPGYETRYHVSNLGRVRRVGKVHGKSDCYRILKPYNGTYGHGRVQLCMDGHKKRELVHRLVAKAFLPEPPEGCEVNHIDFDPTNNRVDNLEWVPHRQNILHSRERLARKCGIEHGMVKLTEELVKAIRDRYARGGISFAKLGAEYGICAQQCHRIVRGKRWSHI